MPTSLTSDHTSSRPLVEAEKMEPLLREPAYQAPEWFRTAIAATPVRKMIPVRGVPIEMLSWGKAGRPGILLLHGKAAHADWWSFIAPLLAQDFHIVALSWSGMGASGWRDGYPIDIHVEEAAAVVEAAGLFRGPSAPTVVAHSFATFPTIKYAQQIGAALRSTIIVDPPIFSPQTIEARLAGPRRNAISPHSNPRYATLDEARARFRFAPPQPCDNLYIADFIARTSLKQVTEDGKPAWMWRFDRRHFMRQNLQHIPATLDRIACPLTFILGERSTLRSQQDDRYMRDLYPKGTREITIPDAAHHVMVDQPIAFISVLRTLLSEPA